MQRIKSHAQYGSHDLEEWAFSFLELTEGLKILELGCGSGKQSIPLADRVGNQGRVLAVDISQDALDTLLREASAQQLANRIDLLRAELDDIGVHLDAEQFDRALSCYALYYARDQNSVLRHIHNALKPRGIFFFCGPGKDNNAELKEFHYALAGENTSGESSATKFMSETGQQLAREIFTTVNVSTFENTLRFVSAEDLYLYWRSYNLYERGLDYKFRAEADKYFGRHEVFETSKRVIGVQAIK
jgi:ubiquinone/menaquinone biosynthesis C-methylase UbiE